MSEVERDYMIRVREVPEGGGLQAFTFVPNGMTPIRLPNEPPKRMPQIRVYAQILGDGIAFDWSASPDDPGKERSRLEVEVRRRIEARLAWTDLVGKLVTQVREWATEFGWATRTIEKRLDDSYVGKHTVQALLMQEETCRVLLEPVGRSAPGAEGLVDLYLLPAYDDIASLYYYGDRWNVHYYFPGEPQKADIRETPSRPLSKEILRTVLDEMRANAI